MIELIMWLDCAYDETSLEVKCLARRIEFNNQPAMKRQLDIDELDALGEFGGRWRNLGNEVELSSAPCHKSQQSFVPSRMYNEGSATR